VNLTNRQKAAALLMSVDSGTAAMVLKNLNDKELTMISKEMAIMDQVDPETANAVFTEFSNMARNLGGLLPEESTSLREILEKALGPQRAEELLGIIGVENRGPAPFQVLHDMEPEELRVLLSGEHPQTVALVLQHLPPRLASGVLALTSEEAQADIVRRMARTEQTGLDVLQQVDAIIRAKTRFLGERRKTPAEKRFKAVADMLNLSAKDIENRVMQHMEREDPDIAKEIRNLMFVFDDIATLPDNAIRVILSHVDTQALALALKLSSEEVKTAIFRNLSKRAQEMVEEELELLGPKPRSQVEQAQRQIIDIVRELEAAGEIQTRGAGAAQEEMV